MSSGRGSADAPARGATVRLATVADLAEIARLEAELFPDGWSSASIAPYVVCGHSGAGRAAWVADPLPGDWQAIIPRPGIAGYLLISWVLDEGTIDRIGVSGKHQRRGIGRFLLDYGMGQLEAHGVRAVWLEVGASNRAAVRLYESVGFRVVSRRRGYYVGPPPDDALVMNKVIR